MDAPATLRFQISSWRICFAWFHPCLTLRAIPVMGEFYMVDGMRNLPVAEGLSKKNGGECHVGSCQRDSKS
jgi:hypothetical protein